MYKEYKGLNLPEIDAEMLRFWEENGIFEKSVNQRDEENSWVFYEGPPSANGKPGIHHVMARTIKDLFCRYRSMKGSRVERKGGWDTHGLPVELGVEKELGITKEDIGKTISIADYNKKCRESVMRYKDMWDDITRKMGYWVDLDNPYVTYENEYIESVWHLLKRLYDKDLIYKGFTIQPYSPAAGTGLSSHELNQPGAYQDITDTSAVAQFKLKGKDNEYILAWTTTPWTLPSNAALAVGKKIVYVKVKTLNRYTHQPATVILAKERLAAYFTEAKPDLKAEDLKGGNKPMPYIEIVEELTGADLAGLEYEQLMPYVQPDKPAFRVITADFVSTSDGTGIVHIAPTFGADDFMVAKQNDIPPIMIKDENDKDVPLVDKQGRLVAEVTDFAGRYVKDYGQKEDRSVDVDIVIKLKEENLLFLSEKYVHSYPHCWRTDKPVLYYPLDSWFIKASSVKDRMVELNKDIQWKPKSTGEGRFGKWLENLQDWNLSRSRYWGIPLPIWRTEDGLSQKCIGSIAELEKEIQLANEKLGLNQTTPKDLHRPYIDDVILVTENGEEMKRELDLIDVWFDSGSMPYAQWHYPFENEETFNRSFPADFIAEGVDQTRGWFYTLHAIATMVFDKPAFKNVVSNGLVQDKLGKKMSKRLNNAVEPFETIAKYGADATRWYMISNAQVWDNLKFDIAGLDEVRRKFFGTLYNTYSFFSLYANVDGFTYKEPDIPLEERPEIDRWIISLLNTLVKEVDAEYNDYEATNAARKIMGFVDDHLSNWYVRLCRRRFWKGDYSEDKIAAYQTLYECLNTIMKLMAPLAPFFSDWMYQNLDKATGKEGIESIHLADFPAVNEAVIDKALEERMDYAQRIASLVLSLRKKDKLRVRQPLKRALLPVLNESFQHQVEQVKDLILAEVNVEKLEYITDTSGLISKKIKPNFKTLGRKLGKDMKAAMGIITALGQEDIADIEKTGQYTLNINGTTHDLTLEDFEIQTQDIPGWQVASDGPLTVALDVTVTPELAAEGMARDIVNRIQNIRKEKGFEVTDRINVSIQKHEALTAALDGFSDYIKEETLMDGLSIVENVDDGVEIELPGEVLVFVGVILLDEPKEILDLNEKKAKEFLIKKESYSSLELPFYFTFQSLLDKVNENLDGKSLSDFRKSSPRDFDDINYKLLSNKDGKYSWRPFQLIHPAIYVSLVHEITKKENWNVIKERFNIFQQNKKIECHSLPVTSGIETRTDKTEQILTWWQMIEQRSLTLALDFKYVLHTDISDCYGSIYTHTIPWALHTQEKAKKKKNRNEESLIGVFIDKRLQDMSFGQTNGIPQGSILMDFIAEIVLGYVDLLLSKKLDKLKIENYKILRYRDDYRVFTNNPFEAEQITKELSEVLSNLGMKLNAEKTTASDDIIKSSIKPDKRYWISNKIITESKQKWLIQLYLLSEKFPNSGTIYKEMIAFLKVLKKSKKNDSNLETLVSLVIGIALRNPKVVPIAIAILSIFINRIKGKSTKIELIEKVKAKFDQVPNSSLLMIWFQRLDVKISELVEYSEPLCKKVINKEEMIWNSSWLKGSLKEIINKTPIVEKEILKEMESRLSKEEMEKIIMQKVY